MDIQAYWQAVLAQDAEAMASFFTSDARIRWHNSNEEFSAAEFIRANCQYPGEWQGEIERQENLQNQIITVCRVWPRDNSRSFHVTSFLRIRTGLIAAIDEYWGDDGPAPQWRQELNLGRPIHA